MRRKDKEINLEKGKRGRNKERGIDMTIESDGGEINRHSEGLRESERRAMGKRVGRNGMRGGERDGGKESERQIKSDGEGERERGE